MKEEGVTRGLVVRLCVCVLPLCVARGTRSHRSERARGRSTRQSIRDDSRYEFYDGRPIQLYPVRIDRAVAIFTIIIYIR